MVDYYKRRPIDSECHEIDKSAQKLLKKKDTNVEGKLELLYKIETQFTFTEQDRIPVNNIKAIFMKWKKETS